MRSRKILARIEIISMQGTIVNISVADPGSGAFFDPASEIRVGKNQDQEPGSRSGMNILDHISQILET